MTPKFYALRIESIQPLTEDSSIITFEVPKDLEKAYAYTAGQYLTIRSNIDGVEVRRSYSLCSSPSEKRWSIGIKRVVEGVFSNYALNTLSKGDLIDVMTPAGGFTYHPKTENVNTIVLIAAGSGITPILSIAKTILDNEPLSKVCMFFGNKGFVQVMFSEELESLKNKYVSRFRLYHVFSQESQGIPLLKGRMNHEKLNALYDGFLTHDNIEQVYVCGPEAMIHDVAAVFEQRGLQKNQIHFELFTSGIANKAEKNIDIIEDVDCEVELIIDDDTMTFSMNSKNQSILDAAQIAGADVPFACKGGVCCTCKAKILEGSAKMRVNYSLEPDEVENGYILTCQAIPTSKKILISFDE